MTLPISYTLKLPAALEPLEIRIQNATGLGPLQVSQTDPVFEGGKWKVSLLLERHGQQLHTVGPDEAG